MKRDKRLYDDTFKILKCLRAAFNLRTGQNFILGYKRGAAFVVEISSFSSVQRHMPRPLSTQCTRSMGDQRGRLFHDSARVTSIAMNINHYGSYDINTTLNFRVKLTFLVRLLLVLWSKFAFYLKGHQWAQ